MRIRRSEIKARAVDIRGLDGGRRYVVKNIYHIKREVDMTDPRPTLETDRLILRPFSEIDIPAIVQLVNDRAVSSKTLRIPHPYGEAEARTWLTAQIDEFKKGTGVVFAVVGRNGNSLMGACGLEIDREHRRGELGYWLGRDFWGCGYATESALIVIDWGFRILDLNKISAARFHDNPASGRVLEKVGMKEEGYLRQHVLRNRKYRDLVMYGILREEWELRG